MKIKIVRLDRSDELYSFSSKHELNIIYVNVLKEFILHGKYFYSIGPNEVRKIRKILKENGFKVIIKKVPPEISTLLSGYYLVKFTKEEEFYLLLSGPMELG